MKFIDLKTQYKRIESKIQSGLNHVLEHGQYIMGPEIKTLEKQLADFIGVKHAIGVGSGTDALLLALMALGIGKGDEVITVPFSFFATAEMIVLAGATPVFVDIDPRTYNMDPALIKKAITSKTKAIMPVGLFGQCPDLDTINAIAKEHNLYVIEDAAQSFGGTYKGSYSGALTTIGCTSFYPAKPLGGYGDSGACFTNDDKLADKMRQLLDHGQDKRYHHSWIGINGRMDSFQAVVLSAKLELLKEELVLRQQAAKRYDESLSKIVQTPYIEPFNTSSYAQYTVMLPERDKVQAFLQAEGIPTMVHYPIPIHLQPAMAYLGLKAGSFSHSEKAASNVLSLPMHPYLTEEDQDKVVQALSRAVTAVA